MKVKFCLPAEELAPQNAMQGKGSFLFDILSTQTFTSIFCPYYQSLCECFLMCSLFCQFGFLIINSAPNAEFWTYVVTLPAAGSRLRQRLTDMTHTAISLANLLLPLLKQQSSLHKRKKIRCCFDFSVSFDCWQATVHISVGQVWYWQTIAHGSCPAHKAFLIQHVKPGKNYINSKEIRKQLYFIHFFQ